ncbi:transposase [Microcoleus sp. AR_TQ3_B6]|uniref:transposase n=1 Tax=Microcoleus sp. AR_TQ3_B6 TaxID=3055284 RepID=UPI002FD09DC4
MGLFQNHDPIFFYHKTSQSSTGKAFDGVVTPSPTSTNSPANLQPVLRLFSQYKVIVLRDREFCSIDLANWLKEKGVYFCLRLKRNDCIEIEHLVWQRLDELGIVPRTSLYFQGKRVRKTQPATGFDVACKWKRNYAACQVDEAWFILTNLGSLGAALNAYKQRMGIEKMFRDCKTFGYDLEGTSLKPNRLINMILLMTLAYSSAIFQGTLTEEKAGTRICISSQRTQEKIWQTEYIWCWFRWRKVG